MTGQVWGWESLLNTGSTRDCYRYRCDLDNVPVPCTLCSACEVSYSYDTVEEVRSGCGVSWVRVMWRHVPLSLHLLHLLLLLLQLVSLCEGDQRCLLEGGGSTDTFFVREDSRPGEEVGRLRVSGERSFFYHYLLISHYQISNINTHIAPWCLALHWLFGVCLMKCPLETKLNKTV